MVKKAILSTLAGAAAVASSYAQDFTDKMDQLIRSNHPVQEYRIEDKISSIYEEKIAEEHHYKINDSLEFVVKTYESSDRKKLKEIERNINDSTFLRVTEHIDLDGDGSFDFNSTIVHHKDVSDALETRDEYFEQYMEHNDRNTLIGGIDLLRSQEKFGTKLLTYHDMDKNGDFEIRSFKSVSGKTLKMKTSTPKPYDITLLDWKHLPEVTNWKTYEPNP